MRILSLVFISLFLAGCGAILSFPPPHSSRAERILRFESLPAPPFQSPVTVRWNDSLVPFIKAGTDRDAAIALGLIHAHLRLGQMEIGKRVAWGRISEMAGPFTEDIDLAIRTVGFTRAIPEIIEKLPTETMEWLTAFTEGVNHYKRTMKEMPHEMEVLAMGNEPWRVEDTLALSRLGGVDVTWFSLPTLLALRGGGSWESVWSEIARTQAGRIDPSAEEPTPIASTASISEGALSAALSSFARTGSNSFAVSSARSASGAPLIASDPHLGFSVPNLWLLAGIQSPSYRVVGMMPVGLPVFAIGRNDHLAWGGTNMRQWASEFVTIPSEENVWEETHEIERRVLWSTTKRSRMSRFGPVISDLSLFPFPKDVTIALRWTGHFASDETTAMLKVARSRSGEELQEALRTFSLPGQNLIFAEKNGRIGHILATWIPSHDERFPADLWASPEESDKRWNKILTVKELGSLINPNSGIVISTNNRPSEVSSANVGWLFPEPNRRNRLQKLLESQERWSLPEFAALQTDAVNESHRLLAEFIAAETPRDGMSQREEDLLTLLREWRGEYEVVSQGAPILHHLLKTLSERLIADEGARIYWQRNSFLARILMERLQAMELQDRHRELRAALRDTSSSVPSGVRWGDVHRVETNHVLGRIPYLGRRYRFPDIAVPGSEETVMKAVGPLTSERHSVRYGSQSRHVSDLSDSDANFFVLFGGQDGWINSENERDQISEWSRGTFIQMPLTEKMREKNFRYVTEFRGREG